MFRKLVQSRKAVAEITSLKEQLAQSEALVAELKETISRYREREEMIHSLRIEAEEKCQAMIQLTEEEMAKRQEQVQSDIDYRLQQIQDRMADISACEMELRSKGDLMKNQLRSLLTEQLKAVEAMDISVYATLFPVVTDTAAVVEKVEKESKTIIKFPDLTNEKANETTQLPVYSFKE